MTVQLSPAALRSREQRERRKAETPTDVRALIERGRRERDELERQARDAAEVGRLLAQIDARWTRIKRAANVSSRARMLADFADFLVDEERQALLTRVKASGRILRVDKNRCQPVPPWIPDDMRAVYRERSRLVGEITAASEFRRLKREAEAEANG